MFPKNGNKLHPQRRPNEVALNFNRTIAAALQWELGSTHCATKTAMRWTGASERTAKHWLSGIHGPSGVHRVQLLPHSDEVLKAVLILTDRPDALSGAKAAQTRMHLMAANALEIAAIDGLINNNHD